MDAPTSIDALLAHWRQVLARAAVELGQVPAADACRRPAPGKWSASEIIGHLVDSATNNHRRFVVAQLQPDLVFSGYDQDAWVRVQAYADEDWPGLAELWVALNRHLIHVVDAMPREDLLRPRPVHNLDEIAWQPVPRSEPTTLAYFVADYVAHLEHHLAQLRRTVAITSPATR
ncbi:MAG TPA: DinB family protein [Gemmatimonadales bacterium]|nr:DinB family protein [Gemmatimonadales bacterium]